MENKLKDLFKLSIFLFVLGAIIAVLYYGYQKNKEYSFFDDFGASKQREALKNPKIYVKCNFEASVEGKIFSLNFTIPCKTIEQRRDIKEKEPLILNDVIMQISKGRTKKAFENNDFVEIKKRILKVVNKYANEKVDGILINNYTQL